MSGHCHCRHCRGRVGRLRFPAMWYPPEVLFEDHYIVYRRAVLPGGLSWPSIVMQHWRDRRGPREHNPSITVLPDLSWIVRRGRNQGQWSNCYVLEYLQRLLSWIMQAQVHHSADVDISWMATGVEQGHKTSLVGLVGGENFWWKWSVDRRELFQRAAGQLHQVHLKSNRDLHRGLIPVGGNWSPVLVFSAANLSIMEAVGAALLKISQTEVKSMINIWKPVNIMIKREVLVIKGPIGIQAGLRPT